MFQGISILIAAPAVEISLKLMTFHETRGYLVLESSARWVSTEERWEKKKSNDNETTSKGKIQQTARTYGELENGPLQVLSWLENIFA